METYKIKSEKSPLYIQKVMFILGGCDIFLQDFARFVILLCSCFALCVYPFEYELWKCLAEINWKTHTAA